MITTILPQTSDPKENQKSLLDLASKIRNEEEIFVTLDATRTSPYTIPDGIGPITIMWTPGASLCKVQFGSTVRNRNRRIRIIKLGTGAGEIQVLPKSGELIGLWTSVYIGKQNQINEFNSTPGVWEVIGPVQPVAGEKCLGQDREYYYDFGIPAAPTVGYYDLSASFLPVGTTRIYIRLGHTSNTIAKQLAAFTDSTPTPATSPVRAITQTANSLCDMCGYVTLDSSRHFVYWASATLASAFIRMYYYTL